MVSSIFNDTDQDAALADLSPRLLITAPPGSGKTFTAMRLAARDIDAGLVGPTQRVLVLTFSRQARGQLERYARSLLTDEQRSRVVITNYHSWFWTKIYAFRASLGLPLDLDLSTGSQHREDVEVAMFQAGLTSAQIHAKGALDDYGRAHEFATAAARPTRLSEPLHLGGQVSDRLQARHKTLGRIHYDDMAFYMWKLIDRSARLRAVWSHKYPVMILDEHQDSSPLQSLIVERLAADGSRIYAFADPLQMIYGFRDASPDRVPEFKAKGASVHQLRTLHRYRERPALQAWMEGVRDVLLNGSQSCPPLPPNVKVIRYAVGRSNRTSKEPYDTHSRDLWRIDEPVSKVLTHHSIGSVAVMVRKHAHLARVEQHLNKRFYSNRLRAGEDAADWAREWIDRYATTSASRELRAGHLLEVAALISPRNADVADLRRRLGADGIQASRLKGAKRILADQVNDATEECDTLAGAIRAAARVAALAGAHEQPRLVAREAVQVVRRVFAVHSSMDDDEARDRVLTRISQLRHDADNDTRPGLYLLTCHQSKGKEFDAVVVPYLTSTIFEDTDEGRQLLYVTLTRARKLLLIRVGDGQAPPFAATVGLA